MTTTTAAPTLTKAGFVRAQPEDMSVEDVISGGAKKGLEIKAADVHAARYYMRQQNTKDGSKKGAKVAKKAGNGRKKATAATNGSKTNGDVAHVSNRTVRKARAPRDLVAALDGDFESQFKGLVVRVGTTRARQLIEAIEGA